MFRMLRLARLAPVVVAALLSLMLALSYAVAQSNVSGGAYHRLRNSW